MARIWSWVLPSVFSRKYQSASTRMQFIVHRLSFLIRRAALIQLIAAFSLAVRQMEVRRASSGMCFVLGLMRFQFSIDCIIESSHYYFIVQ